MAKAYAFDVDECLEISNGPVKLESLLELKSQGHMVGICGNLTAFMALPNWHEYISFTLNFDTCFFLGGLLPKEYWLRMFQFNCRNAEEYIMVGNQFGRTNSLGHVCGSHDSDAAAKVGWRFILEDDFANGVR